MTRKTLVDSQGDVRILLKSIAVEEGYPIVKLSEAIGISHVSLSRFFNGIDLRVIPLMKIEKWISDHERIKLNE